MKALRCAHRAWLWTPSRASVVAGSRVGGHNRSKHPSLLSTQHPHKSVRRIAWVKRKKNTGKRNDGYLSRTAAVFRGAETDG
ncbi:hypothetical protein FB451DRAFT_1220833 [Mycena latifolia]|nr:hypothetical protein FB451DRAFT_1220833 [Mycena latifolia]